MEEARPMLQKNNEQEKAKNARHLTKSVQPFYLL